MNNWHSNELPTAENGWVNTVDSDSPEAIARAYQIAKSVIYCTISTCSPDGLPWVSPVFFAFDSRWNLYWASAIAAKHSQNIYRNGGRAAVTIFDSNVKEGAGEGLFFYGKASEAQQDELESIINLLSNRAMKKVQKTPKDYLGNSPRRIYQFQPTQAWISGERISVGTQMVDTKIQLNLALLVGK